MSKIDNFAYPTPIPAKIWGCFLWSRSVMLGSAESEMVRLMSREIIFPEFKPIWSRYLNVTDRRTDGQTDGRTTWHDNTALRVASRGKNSYSIMFFFHFYAARIKVDPWKGSEWNPKLKSCGTFSRIDLTCRTKIKIPGFFVKRGPLHHIT